MLVVLGEALVDLVVPPDGSAVPALGGAPYNTARAAARLGVDTTFVGGLSDDRFGQQLRAHLVADGVRCPLEPTTSPTTLALAELDDRGAATYRFYIAGTSAPELERADVASVIGPLAPADLVFTGGLGLVLEPMASSIADAVDARPDHLGLVVDVNCRPAVVDDRERYVARVDQLISTATVVKVSDEDLAFLRPGLEIGAAARSVLDRGARFVVVTAGADPTTIVSRDDIRERPVPPTAGPGVDTIGAGDTFGGGVLADLSELAAASGDRGLDGLTVDELAHAVRLGQVAAAVVVTRRGADPPHRDDLPGEVS